MVPVRRAGPTAEQEWLLQAILVDGGDALEGWLRWSESAELDRLDAGSSRLLPLLYQRIEAFRASPESIDRIRSEYIRTWQANQLRLYDLRQAVDHLQGAGIPVLLLKGAALLVACYTDPGLRPMADCDLLVPYAMAPRATELLNAAGWTPRGAQPHEQTFTNEGGFDLDLHWNVFAARGGPAIDEPFWEAAERTAFGDTSTLVMCPADQLLHVCVHGAIWNPTPGLRWIVDAATLVKNRKGMDWDRLVRQAQRCRMALTARTTLRYLRERFGVRIPEEVLRRMDAMEISRAERTEVARQSLPTSARPALREAWAVLASYVWWARARQRVATPAGLLRYLTDRYGLASVRELPRYAASRLARARLNTREQRSIDAG